MSACVVGCSVGACEAGACVVGCPVGACVVGWSVGACVVGWSVGACVAGCAVWACVVGCAFGACVVGCVVGACVVGWSVGACVVGWSDGACVARCAVGACVVGCAVGACAVGWSVGACVVGCAVGACVDGSSVGACVVGCAVGACVVGCAVGACVGTGLPFWRPGRRGGRPKVGPNGSKIEPKQDARASCSRALPGRLFGVTFVSRVGTGQTFGHPGRRGGGPKWVQSGSKIEPKQDARVSCSRALLGRLFGVTFVSRVGTGVAFWRPGEVRGLQKGTARRREGAKTNAAGNKSYHPFSLTVVSLASSGRALKT
jgi:hypothetical protein